MAEGTEGSSLWTADGRPMEPLPYRDRVEGLLHLVLQPPRDAGGALVEEFTSPSFSASQETSSSWPPTSPSSLSAEKTETSAQLLELVDQLGAVHEELSSIFNGSTSAEITQLSSQRLALALGTELMYEYSPWFAKRREQSVKFPWSKFLQTRYPDAKLGTLSAQEYVVSQQLKDILVALDYQRLQQHPERIHGVVGAIFNTKFPFMGEYITTVAPLLLNLVHHVNTAIQCKAVSALQHFLSHVNASDIRWNGLDKAIYQEIKSLLYSTDAEIISCSWPCMAVLLPILQKPPTTLEDTMYDEVWDAVLAFSPMQTEDAKCLAIAQHLGHLIKVSGLYVVIHSRQLLPMLSELCTHANLAISRAAITSVIAFCQATAPRASASKTATLQRIIKHLEATTTSHQETTNLLPQLQTFLS
eukprot:m.176051 g.176051  ORF g.176051 m.176051 type:complete len:416 (-) comp16554_c0_seq5:206-1453(-)